ncbi:MAG: bifunctional (p)ppGpp synthetase/guanosine-3',5'-bis(diphosphate) 3'-pyrophosphohydrolase, partial [Clostridia bacterium]|nr:bifunctional (p)ppGpp synthetase/guanosine-3',5'-bis(diphosphate) 3'-pyrophosphohydrolase [Clostridia bacterium]
MKNVPKAFDDEFKTPEEGCALLSGLLEDFDEADRAAIRKAYDFAFEAHKNQTRLSGEPYIMHPLAVAVIIASLGMDSASIIAAMLHNTVEDTGVTIEDIKENFGETAAELVDGLTKIKNVPTKTEEATDDPVWLDPTRVKQQQQAENIRKMLLAMNKDIRVIIVKLADRLHNMRTLMYKEETRRREIALETIEIYAPIAHRLGIRPIKDELEDLSISYLDPVAYKEIQESLEHQSKTRMEFLDDIRERIRVRAQELVPNAQVSGRIKSAHGIYRKMYMQNKNFDQIYDIYAVRIIVDTVIDCYNCLGIIHDMFKPIPGRFKDYISNPKANMYQSL